MLMRPWIRTVLPLKAVQPGLITDRAQVLNKAGENLMRVRLAEVDESNTFWRCMNAGNHSLNINLLAGVLGGLRWSDGVGRQCC